jgi:hypothetical protein
MPIKQSSQTRAVGEIASAPRSRGREVRAVATGGPDMVEEHWHEDGAH